MNTYRQLTAPELVNLFDKICGGYINKGRDSRMLAVLRDEKGLTPPQILLGIYTWQALGGTKDIPSFIRAPHRWLIEDPLEAEAELCLYLGLNETHPLLLSYLDFRDCEMLDARIEKLFQFAKASLEQFIARVLDKSPAAKHRGTWAASQRGIRSRSASHPESRTPVR